MLLLPLAFCVLPLTPSHVLDGSVVRQRPASVQDEQEATRQRHDAAAMIRARHGVESLHPLSEEDAFVWRAIESGSIPAVRWEDVEDLGLVRATLNAALATPIVITRGAAEAMSDEGIALNIHKRKVTPARALLDEIARAAGPSIDWTVRDGAITFGTDAELQSEVFAHLHPIADLLGLFDAEDVATLVSDGCSPQAWEREGRAIELTPSFLIVLQTRDVQLEVEALLVRLARLCKAFEGPPALKSSPASDPETRWFADMQSLESGIFEVDFEPESPLSLADLASWIGERSHLGIRIEPSVFDELDADEALLQLGKGRMPLSVVLRRMELQLPEISWSVVDHTIVIHTQHDAPGNTILAFHDVRAIVGPARGAFASGGQGAPTDEVLPWILAPDQLGELIRCSVLPESWDMDPANTISITHSGLLTVAQSPRGHRELRELLDRLFGIASTMLEVEARDD